MNKIRLGDTVYYTDPLKDEFSGIVRPPITIDKDFRFVRNNPLYRAAKFVVYRIFVTPFAYLYCKLHFGFRMVGREKLKAAKGKGFFLFGNHTQVPGDGFIPNVITFPKETHVIVNPDNIALKGTRTLMMMLGALPTPTEMSGFTGFFQAITEHIRKRRAIVIYPEAHIWPYASVIRPFPDTSFRYPAKLNAPVYAFTVTYRRGRHGRPEITAYVDGPFTAQGTVKERQKMLREQVYNAMTGRAHSENNVAFVHYLPKEDL